jgi:ATP-dependent helicase/nuclease subunit A
MVGDTIERELAGQFPNEVIRASAGTGKTFALSNRYLKLLASGVECQSILATTFTRKGAGEILDRIIGRLSDAALDDSAAAKLSSELGWEISQARARDILHDLLGNLHRLEISTLDSFFNRVAKAFSLELRLPPNWEIVEEQEINRMKDQAIQSVLRNDSVVDLLHMLSKGEATRRVASMVRETVDQIYEIYRETGPDPWSKIPASGKLLSREELDALILRMESIDAGGKQLTKHWGVVTEFVKLEEWDSFIENTSFQNMLMGVPKYSRTKLPVEIVEVYELLIPHCQAFVSQRLRMQNEAVCKLLAAYGQLIEAEKNRTGNLRFQDVTERLQEFIALYDADRLSFRLDRQVHHLLLDEFQDTSLGQWSVIQPFARKVTEDSDSLKSFFCVGDLKQAIFGWRGGIAEIFDLVDQQLPNLQPDSLAKSWRSSQPLIDMVNQVFMNVKQYSCGDELIEKEICRWSSKFEEHTTARDELRGYVAVEMAADCPEGSRRFEDTKDKIRNQNMIQRTVKRIQQLETDLPPHHSIGVIARTNDQVSDLIFELQQAGVPASEEGGGRLTDSAAVEAVLAAMKLADHPDDSISRFHLSHSPLADHLGLVPETKETRQKNVAAAREAAVAIRGELINAGYGSTVEKLAKQLTEQCTRREIFRLQQLVRVAYDCPSDDPQWLLRPSRFVAFVRDEVKVSDQSSARVRVMTVHKAKGLEFDAVVLPISCSSRGWAGQTPTVVAGRNEPTAPISVATRYIGSKLRKLLPDGIQELFDDDRRQTIRESLCVLYVALTRGVNATYVILSHGAKPEHKSSAGILLSTLCPSVERAEGVLYEHGEADWYSSSSEVVEADLHRLAAFYPKDNWLAQKGVVTPVQRSGRGQRRVLPSQVERGSKIKANSFFTSILNAKSMQRGSLLHACFEQVGWLDEKVPTREELGNHLNELTTKLVEVGGVIDDFFEVLKNDNISKLLSRGTYQESYLMEFAGAGEIILEANRLEVECERRFATTLDGSLVQGTMDRVIWVYQGSQLVAADIIDFKSDIVDAEHLQSRIEYYQPQMEVYRRAVSQFAKIPMESIATRLVFSHPRQVINLALIESKVGHSQISKLPESKLPESKLPELELPESKFPKTLPGKTDSPPEAGKQKTLWD